MIDLLKIKTEKEFLSIKPGEPNIIYADLV
jgi:hypothetical protein